MAHAIPAAVLPQAKPAPAAPQAVQEAPQAVQADTNLIVDGKVAKAVLRHADGSIARVDW